MKDLCLGLVLAIVCVNAFDLFPGEIWDSGDVEIDNDHNSLFYYLFKARKPEGHKRVLIIWFNGGPGCAGSISVLQQHGPYIFNNVTLKLEYNKYSFNNHYDILYMDQPVGTGFSNVRSQESYCTNERCVARNFYIFYFKFVTDLHPEYNGVPLYIMGESFAGHFVPSIMKYLLSVDPKNLVIKIAGGGLGNPLTDITNQMTAYPRFVSEVRNVTTLQIIRFNLLVVICRLGRATGLKLFNDFCLYSSDAIYKESGIEYQYDIRITNPNTDVVKEMLKVLNKEETQEMFKVKGYRQVRSPCNSIIRRYLWDDWLDSYAGALEYVLDNANKLHLWLFYGEMDYICNWRGGEFLANSLNWHGKNEFQQAEYKNVVVNATIYGKYKKWENFTFMTVRDAGHSVTSDQLFFSERMLEAFIENGFQTLTSY